MSIPEQLKKAKTQDAIRKDHGGPNSDYGSEYEQRQWLKTQKYRRDKCLKQFCKGKAPYDSELYRQNYDVIDWRKDGDKNKENG